MLTSPGFRVCWVPVCLPPRSSISRYSRAIVRGFLSNKLTPFVLFQDAPTSFSSICHIFTKTRCVWLELEERASLLWLQRPANIHELYIVEVNPRFQTPIIGVPLTRERGLIRIFEPGPGLVVRVGPAKEESKTNVLDRHMMLSDPIRLGASVLCLLQLMSWWLVKLLLNPTLKLTYDTC